MVFLDVDLGELNPRQERDLRRYCAGINATHKGARRRARRFRGELKRRLRRLKAIENTPDGRQRIVDVIHSVHGFSAWGV